MIKSTCIALVLLVPSVAAAQKNQQPPPPASTITVQIPGLNCTTPAGTGVFRVDSWSWGATNVGTVTGGTTSAGKPSLQDLAISKSFDGCSAALLGFVTSGGMSKELILTQTGSDVTRTMTLSLDAVLVSSWSLGGRTSEAAPSEQVTFNFRKICVADTASSTSTCYDLATATQ